MYSYFYHVRKETTSTVEQILQAPLSTNVQ